MNRYKQVKKTFPLCERIKRHLKVFIKNRYKQVKKTFPLCERIKGHLKIFINLETGITLVLHEVLSKRLAIKSFLLWSLSLYTNNIHVPVHSTSGKPNIPSFNAMNSLLPRNRDNCLKTRIVSIPIIPYPVTYFDTVHISLINL